LANSSDLAPKSPNDQKLDMSPLCSKQSICHLSHIQCCWYNVQNRGL